MMVFLLALALLIAADDAESEPIGGSDVSELAAVRGTVPTAALSDAPCIAARADSLHPDCLAQVAVERRKIPIENHLQAIVHWSRAKYLEQEIAILREAQAIASVPLPEMAPIPAPVGGQQVTFEATAYCDVGYTADGTYTSWGVIAAGPSYSFGTQMYVPGYGNAVVHDRGGAVSDSVIDLWMPSCDQAIQWGRRTVTVTIY